MTNSAKTVSSKLSEQQIKDYAKGLGKDNIGVESRGGRYRLNISRAYARMYYGKPEKRVSTGLSVLDAQGKIDKANADTVTAKVSQIHNDLANGYFDKTLVKYGLAEETQLKAIDGGRNKPQLSLLDLYGMYCEFKKGTIAETTFKLQFECTYKNAITEAINNVGEDALAIRNWLIEHRCAEIAKNCLRYLDKTYQLGIKHKYVTDNPFEGMAKDIKVTKNTKKNQDNFNDKNEDSDTRAFTVDEMNAIIEAFESSGYRRHLAPIIKFLFWTGCRTGEAIGLRWRDIKWNKELIIFSQTYNRRLKIFKSTKTGVPRFFPMPKDGQVWNLLKSLPEKEPNDMVFQSKTGNIINSINLGKIWRGGESNTNMGVIPELIKQGKVKEYLKLYATRHTFISHQVNIHKIPITTVAQWVGNGAMVSNNSYLDRDKMTVPGYSTTPSEVTESIDVKPDNDEPNQQMASFVASLTPEQREQFKALLNNQ